MMIYQKLTFTIQIGYSQVDEDRDLLGMFDWILHS